jgi:predicted 3-demethylubiquinone-9 3-methyltransferase (glyoxalase superfamily)
MCLIAFSCTDPQSGKNQLAEIEKLQTENDSLRNALSQNEASTDQRIIPFLTFQKGDAEQAMNFYMDLFDNSKVVNLTHWGKSGPGKEGTIMNATFSLDGMLYMCSDSPPIHDWDFTPAVSNYVECEDESEIQNLFASLSENGEVAMPLDNYGFSQKFGWVMDQFGISWQLNLK